MKTEFDVIVVGAGINGIGAGAYLQKAGLDVAVVEKRNEIGPFTLTEDLFGGAGVPVDTCAMHCAIGYSPVMKDLDLERFGLEFIQPDPSYAATWKDGKNLAFYCDPKKTAQAIERFSPKDAETFLRIANKVYSGSNPNETKEVTEFLRFSPPSEDRLHLFWELGKYAGFSPDDFRRMNGVELIDILFENEYTKMAILSVADIGGTGDLRLQGEGAVEALRSITRLFGQVKGGMHNLPHALVRCFKHHGGTLFLSAPVEQVTYEGGVANGVAISEESPYPQHQLKARHAVIMHVTPPVALQILGEEVVKEKDPKLYEKMRDFDFTGHNAFTSYYLLKQPTPWKSVTWDPDIMKCFFIFRAWDSWDHCMQSLMYDVSGEVWKIAGAVGEMYCPSASDPTRFSPEGHCIQSFEVEYSPLLQKYGGLTRWDDREFCDELHRRHTDVLEELAPSFKELIIDSKYITPIDLWRKNPSAILGNETSGCPTGDQWYLGRMPHRSPISHLYFCQSTWPVGVTDIASGYVTAGVVAEDLGVRNQSWWTSRPYDYWLAKMGLG